MRRTAMHGSYPTFYGPHYQLQGELFEVCRTRFGGVQVRVVEPDYQGPWCWGVSITAALARYACV